MEKKVKKFEDFKLNEAYKEPTEYTKNSFGFNVPVYTYVDNVFDHLVQIICDENQISEKDFTNWDNTRDYIELYFDNNQDVLLDIDQYKITNARYQLCAEHLYNKHFQNDNNILENIKNTDYSLLLEKKSKIDNKLQKSRKILKNMKEKISKYLKFDSIYNKGVVLNLKKPRIKGKTFAGVGFGADKNGFFVYTHRTRSRSYSEPDKIPDKKIAYVKSTG